MPRLLAGCIAVLIVAAPLPAAEPATKSSPDFEIKTKKAGDRVKVLLESGKTIFDVRSPTGISGATIVRRKEAWPAAVVLRLHLRGLESFSATAGKLNLRGSVLSHSGNTKRLALSEEGKSSKQEPAASIQILDAQGKPTLGLPLEGGCFEIAIPKALLQSQPKRLELGWIDFYRE